MTVGMELEWADVLRQTTIPAELGAWNAQDYTIVNSDGHANDPTGAAWLYGGEINTVPTTTAAEQGAITQALAVLLRPTINYRCNLHAHVRPDVDLTADLARLKAVAQYIREAEPFVYSVVEPVPKPSVAGYPDREALAGAVKRYRRRLVSHHYQLPKVRFRELLAAETAQEALDAHAPPTQAGKRAWHLAPRPGINLRSLWKHGTIEYRHFPGTAHPDEVEACADWALQFTRAALAGRPSPAELWHSRAWRIPEFLPYDHRLELGYLATTARPTHTRAVRVHWEHQPLGSSPPARRTTTRLGHTQRGLEWDDE